MIDKPIYETFNNQINIKFHIEAFTKSSSNAYYPGSFRFNDDFCAIGSGSKDGFLVKVFSTALSQIENFFQPCPVVVSIFFFFSLFMWFSNDLSILGSTYYWEFSF
jgi:hypothetical protein